MGLVFISCKPARFLHESVSCSSRVFLVQLREKREGASPSGRGRLPASACVVPVPGPPRWRTTGAQSREEGEVSLETGHRRWGACSTDASCGNASASFEHWLCKLLPTSLPEVLASSSSCPSPVTPWACHEVTVLVLHFLGRHQLRNMGHWGGDTLFPCREFLEDKYIRRHLRLNDICVCFYLGFPFSFSLN